MITGAEKGPKREIGAWRRGLRGHMGASGQSGAFVGTGEGYGKKIWAHQTGHRVRLLAPGEVDRNQKGAEEVDRCRGAAGSCRDIGMVECVCLR